MIDDNTFIEEVRNHVFWRERPPLRIKILFWYDLIQRLKAANRILRKRNTKLIKNLRNFDSKKNNSNKHPEEYCHLCGGKNIKSWYVDNDLWNKVMGKKETICCPLCFVEIAEAKGINPTGWRISREGDKPEMDILRIKNMKLIDIAHKTYVHLKKSEEGYDKWIEEILKVE